MNAGIRLAFVLLVAPTPLLGQGFFDQFSYEGVRLSGVGVDAGAVFSNRLNTAFGGGLRLDWGNIAPRIRVLFTASYFKSDFKDAEIAEFEQQLEGLLPDTIDVSIDLGTISWADIGLGLDLQYWFQPSPRVRPYGGLGFAVHFRDGDGAAIDGTFVENALDMVDAGIVGSLGFEVAVTQTLLLTAEGRGELSTELMTLSARGGVTYRIPYRGAE